MQLAPYLCTHAALLAVTSTRSTRIRRRTSMLACRMTTRQISTALLKIMVHSRSTSPRTSLRSDAADATMSTNGFTDRIADDGILAMGYDWRMVNFLYFTSRVDAIQGRTIQDGTDVNWRFLYFDMTGAWIVFVDADPCEQSVGEDGDEDDGNNLTVWHNADSLIDAVGEVNNAIVVVHSDGLCDLDAGTENPNVTAYRNRYTRSRTLISERHFIHRYLYMAANQLNDTERRRDLEVMLCEILSIFRRNSLHLQPSSGPALNNQRWVPTSRIDLWCAGEQWCFLVPAGSHYGFVSWDSSVDRIVPYKHLAWYSPYHFLYLIMHPAAQRR
ncbi:hypothetical protein CERSUDRAFT_126588 [Gelatoporia subvermispora B]|uniref:Uncharacterized protein n=1 Tax=Ceriporiopsis subvermispora (strain B) TaxID=914234 RepID=M2PB49_CERS8|nr:hypothetical protein CERSUDRAFT_126588 [Gelatoporia subvermispora B]